MRAIASRPDHGRLGRYKAALALSRGGAAAVGTRAAGKTGALGNIGLVDGGCAPGKLGGFARGLDVNSFRRIDHIRHCKSPL